MASLVFDTLKLAKRLSDASGIDIAEPRTELHRELSAMTWKVAALLLAQAASIVALLKLFP